MKKLLRILSVSVGMLFGDQAVSLIDLSLLENKDIATVELYAEDGTCACYSGQGSRIVWEYPDTQEYDPCKKITRTVGALKERGYKESSAFSAAYRLVMDNKTIGEITFFTDEEEVNEEGALIYNLYLNRFKQAVKTGILWNGKKVIKISISQGKSIHYYMGGAEFVLQPVTFYSDHKSEVIYEAH